MPKRFAVPIFFQYFCTYHHITNLDTQKVLKITIKRLKLKPMPTIKNRIQVSDASQGHHIHESQSAKAYPSRTIVHAKLELTEPGNHDEQEADAVANTIAAGGKISREISGGGGASGITVSNQMESQLNHLQGGGQAMPTGLRNMMESGFGQDFSHVRLHTDSEAATLSSSIHAKAFTHGNDIYFNKGQFSPNTAEGQKLMAHELTHVVQGGGVKRHPRDVLESNAIKKGGGEDPSKIAADLAIYLAKKIAKSTGELVQPIQNNWGLVPFVVLNPIDAHKIGKAKSGKKNISTTASNFQQNLCIKNDGPFSCYEYGDEGNAFRHTLWQSIITSQLGADTAKSAGNAHENYENIKNSLVYSSIEEADRQCDLRNNEIGRFIALIYPNLNNNELAQMVVSYFYETGLWEIETVQDEYGGYKYKVIQKRITDEQYKKAIKIIQTKNEFGLSSKSTNTDNKSLMRKPDDTELPAKEYSYIFEIDPTETEKIKNLKTRKERALYLFGDKAYDALEGKRIFEDEKEARDNMESVSLKFFTVNGKDQASMRVHKKLAEYVKEIFNKIYDYYSKKSANKCISSLNHSSESEHDVFFMLKDGNEGAFNWRYSRYDIEGNEKTIRQLEEENKSLNQTNEELNETNKTLLNRNEQLLNENPHINSKKNAKNPDAKEYKQNKKEIDKNNKAIKSNERIIGKNNRKINRLQSKNKSIEIADKNILDEITILQKEIEDEEKEKEKVYELKCIEEKKIDIIDGKIPQTEFYEKEQERITSMSENDYLMEQQEKISKEVQFLKTELENLNIRNDERKQILSNHSQEEIAEIMADENSKRKHLARIEKRKSIGKSKKDDAKKAEDLSENIRMIDLIKANDIEDNMEKINSQIIALECQSPMSKEEIIEDLKREIEFRNNLENDRSKYEKGKVGDKKFKQDILKEIQKYASTIKKIDKDINKKKAQIEAKRRKTGDYQSGRFSEHAAGVAIDLNPRYNPHYKDGENVPNMHIGTENDLYTIKEDSELVRIFREYGWKWGGDWKTRDYMHFEWFSKTWPRE